MIKDFIDTYRDAFRQWVRTKTRPKSILEAEEKRLFWSKCYLISVLCAMGVYIYQLSANKAKSGLDANSMALRLAKGSEDESIKIVKYSGFKHVYTKTLNPNDIEESDLKGKGPTPEVT